MLWCYIAQYGGIQYESKTIKIHDMNYDVEVTWQKESMWLFLNQLQLTWNQGEEPSNKNNDNWN